MLLCIDIKKVVRCQVQESPSYEQQYIRNRTDRSAPRVIFDNLSVSFAFARNDNLASVFNLYFDA